MVEQAKLEISYSGNHSVDFQDDIVRIDPYSLFLHAMKSPVTKKKYSRRLEMFFDFLKLPGESLVERCLTFVNNGKDNVNWVFTNILKFVLFYKQRIDIKEISWSDYKSSGISFVTSWILMIKVNYDSFKTSLRKKWFKIYLIGLIIFLIIIYFFYHV